MSENTPGQPDGPQFNPQTGYPVGQEPPAQPPSYGQNPYGQNPYGQNPYPYGQPYPPQPGYPGPQYGQPFAPYGVPDHPRATTALVLGLVGLVGGLMCGVPLLAAPFAWVIGLRARRQIRQSNGQLGGEGSAQAGMVLGIIGTVLLVLALIGLIVLIAVVVGGSTTTGDYGTV